MAPGQYGCHIKIVAPEHLLRITLMPIAHEIVPWWMPQGPLMYVKTNKDRNTVHNFKKSWFLAMDVLNTLTRDKMSDFLQTSFANSYNK